MISSLLQRCRMLPRLNRVWHPALAYNWASLYSRSGDGLPMKHLTPSILRVQETNRDIMLSFIHACVHSANIYKGTALNGNHTWLLDKGSDLNLALLFRSRVASLCLSFFACKIAIMIKLTSQVILDMKRWVKHGPQREVTETPWWHLAQTQI